MPFRLSPPSRPCSMCHNTAFDFNDNVSPLAAVLFVRIVEDRLGVTLYDEAELPMPLLVPPEAAAEDKAGTAGLIQLPASKKAKKK